MRFSFKKLIFMLRRLQQKITMPNGNIVYFRAIWYSIASLIW